MKRLLFGVKLRDHKFAFEFGAKSRLKLSRHRLYSWFLLSLYCLWLSCCLLMHWYLPWYLWKCINHLHCVLAVARIDNQVDILYPPLLDLLQVLLVYLAEEPVVLLLLLHPLLLQHVLLLIDLSETLLRQPSLPLLLSLPLLFDDVPLLVLVLLRVLQFFSLQSLMLGLGQARVAAG
jgi:hypothetical protein